MTRPALVEIDFDALRHNLSAVKQRAPKSKVIAMIKANAYGHGLVRVAQALKEADAFGVAGIDEAIILRRSGVENPIVVMAGFFSPDELYELERLHFSVVLHTEEQIRILEHARLTSPLNVWLKINTGMHRLGFHPSRIEEIYRRLLNCSAIQRPIGFMTHFSDADNKENKKTERQIQLFHETVRDYDGERSLANSAGIINFPEAFADWIRPGLMLYGISPIAGKTGKDFGLQPVMTLRSKIIGIRKQNKGDEIGYSSSFVCSENMLVGIIAMGYGDGYLFHVSTGTPVLVKSALCRVVGRVAMDMIAVDLSAYPDAKIGDDVVLWGKGLPVEEIALAARTIPYELVCGIARRVQGAE